jgi:single-strand DNA-binding protein
MNKLILIGNLTHDPEIRATPSGVTVCSFTIAVNRRFAPAGGERPVDFFRINAWRQLGDACARNLCKGRKVAVIGELQARTYEAKDGTTRMSLDVQADEVEFLSPKPQKDDSGYENQTTNAPDMTQFSDISPDDIPF